MKKDGHIKFYTLYEWRQLAETAGFTYHDSFETQIRFPRKMDAAFGLECIMKSFDKKTISGLKYCRMKSGLRKRFRM